MHAVYLIYFSRPTSQCLFCGEVYHQRLSSLMQGVEADDSDLECDDHLQRRYWEISITIQQAERDPVAAHVDLAL
jgi:hypothetical protein